MSSGGGLRGRSRVIDRAWALLHEIEGKIRRHRIPLGGEPDDYIAGIMDGRQAERAEWLDRLHWVIDPDGEWQDIRDAEALIRRLNQLLEADETA